MDEPISSTHHNTRGHTSADAPRHRRPLCPPPGATVPVNSRRARRCCPSTLEDSVLAIHLPACRNPPKKIPLRTDRLEALEQTQFRKG